MITPFAPAEIVFEVLSRRMLALSMRQSIMSVLSLSPPLLRISVGQPNLTSMDGLRRSTKAAALRWHAARGLCYSEHPLALQGRPRAFKRRGVAQPG